MNPIVKGALVVGALIVVGAGLVAGLRGGGTSPEPGGAPAPHPAQKQTLTIAAAADLKFALDELVKDFRAKHSGADIQVTYGSSGNFLAQISNGAPFDVFLSADVAYPRKLAEQGLVSEDGVFPYAVGRLVVWVPRGSPLAVETLGMKALLEPAARRIAIANPQHAPYGRAAEAALRNLGIYDAIKDKLVLGENIAQTAQFVQSGSADAGIIALSLALAPAMKEGRHWEVPLDAYPSLEQGGAILKRARDVQLAKQFRDYLLGTEGKALLKRYGFFLPGA